MAEDEIEELPEIEEVLDLDETEDLGEGPLVYDDDEPNLAMVFLDHPTGRDWLADFANDVMDRYESSKEDSEEHRQRVAADWKIFSGDLPAKEVPYENCANPSVPIMLENTMRIAMRVESEVFADWRRIFTWVPSGQDDKVIAEAKTRHTNWQFYSMIPDFKRQQKAAILQFIIEGDVTIQSHYDSETWRNRHDTLSADDFITPYLYVTRERDYSDLPYYFRQHRYYVHQLEAKRDIWARVNEVLDGDPPGWESADDTVREEMQTVENISSNGMSESGVPYRVIQYEGWEQLPGQDRQRWVRAYINSGNREVMSLEIHEEPEWHERARFEEQIREKNEFMERLQRHQVMVQQQQQMVVQMMAQMPPGTPPPQIPPPPPAPVAPRWMKSPTDEPVPPRTRPIYMFTHACCIEPPAGNLGLGFGRSQADFSRSANTAMGQFTDAATLANCHGWFVDASVQMPDGIDISPGAVNQVRGITGRKLSEAIMPMTYGPANPQLMEVTRSMYEWGQSSMQSPGVLSGEPGKSGETYRGISIRVEQATKQLSVMTSWFADSLVQIAINNARLNAIYMPEDEVLYLTDPRTGNVEELRVGRALYQRGYNVEVVADLDYQADEAKIAEADGLAQMVSQHPYLAGNAAVNHAALVRQFEARELFDMIPLLGPAPPVQPFGPPPQEEEEEAPAPGPSDGGIGPAPDGGPA